MDARAPPRETTAARREKANFMASLPRSIDRRREGKGREVEGDVELPLLPAYGRAHRRC